MATLSKWLGKREWWHLSRAEGREMPCRGASERPEAGLTVAGLGISAGDSRQRHWSL